MNHSNSSNLSFQFRSPQAANKLRAVKQRVEDFNWGNAKKYGVIDRSEQCFLFYSDLTKGSKPWDSEADWAEWPSQNWLMRQLNEKNRAFVGDTLDLVHRFLKRTPPENYPLYRLSLDLCTGNNSQAAQRVLVHLRYLAPDKYFPDGLCLFSLHPISKAQAPSPPLRAFCSYPDLKPVLFRKEKSRIPEFTEKKCLHLEGLREGKYQKELAGTASCAESSVNNLLTDCRKHLQLGNNHQLSYYAMCFGSL